MYFVPSLVTAALALVGLVSAVPTGGFKDKRSFVERDGVNFTVFEHAATGAKLEFVTNSGICETTPGVQQFSGYLSVGTNMNMWFWFFEARNNPTTAPIATWFNGGPGCSSMIGLFQENGPCHFVGSATTPTLNPFSWNTNVNMLYIDQPIGVGFSFGTDNVGSTVTAAPLVWTFLQAFFAQFPTYESRDFGLFTESYGGHYGPEFADFFLQQNTKIASKTITGDHINLVALGINNGWYDPIIQYKAYIDFSLTNDYRSIITSSQHTSLMNTYTSSCLPELQQCTATTGQNTQCVNALNTCGDRIEDAIIDDADFDVYDIRSGSDDPFPPETYVNYLRSSAVTKAIGAQATYQECPNAPFNLFENTGDDSRSFLAALGDVVSSGNVTTTIWAGSADWICNWVGGLASAEAIKYPDQSAFVSKAETTYTVNGVAGGTFKTQGKLSWLKVTDAGHEVPAYQPELALQVFTQTMNKGPLVST